MRLAVVLLMLASIQISAHADDWPRWRGPQGEGVWRESGIIDAFPQSGPRVLWRAPIGRGYSGPSVADGRIFVMDRQLSPGPTTTLTYSSRLANEYDGVERILCLDAQSGKPLWEYAYQCRYAISYGGGPRTTPTVCGDTVYTLGAMGHIHCLDAATGKLRWSKDLCKDYNVRPPAWGFSNSLLVEGDLVITLVGGTGQTVVAFNRNTGEEVWRALDCKTPGYCPPMIVDIGQGRQLLVWYPGGLTGLDSSTGKVAWSIPYAAQLGMSIATPGIQGKRICLSTQFEGATMYEFKEGSVEPQLLWRLNSAKAKTAGVNSVMSPLLFRDGCVFDVDTNGEFRCLEADTGKHLWTTTAPTTGTNPPKDRWCTLFMVSQGHRDWIFNERGDLIIARLTREKYEEISRAHILDADMPSSGPASRKVIWAHPAFANRCIYARNDQELICVSLAKP